MNFCLWFLFLSFSLEKNTWEWSLLYQRWGSLVAEWTVEAVQHRMPDMSRTTCATEGSWKHWCVLCVCASGTYWERSDEPVTSSFKSASWLTLLQAITSFLKMKYFQSKAVTARYVFWNPMERKQCLPWCSCFQKCSQPQAAGSVWTIPSNVGFAVLYGARILTRSSL